jgi:hypothetical protein
MQDPRQNTELGYPHFFLEKNCEYLTKRKEKKSEGYVTVGIRPIACYCQEEYMVGHIHYRSSKIDEYWAMPL